MFASSSRYVILQASGGVCVYLWRNKCVWGGVCVRTLLSGDSRQFGQVFTSILLLHSAAPWGFFRGKAAVRVHCCDDRRKWPQSHTLNCSAASKETRSCLAVACRNSKLSKSVGVFQLPYDAVDRNKAWTSCFLLMMQPLEYHRQANRVEWYNFWPVMSKVMSFTFKSNHISLLLTNKYLIIRLIIINLVWIAPFRHKCSSYVLHKKDKHAPCASDKKTVKKKTLQNNEV